jgi:hypothetical protein
MPWISLIIALINALPSIIKIIEMLRDALKNESVERKAAFKSEIRDVYTTFKSDGDSLKATNALKNILHRIVHKDK